MKVAYLQCIGGAAGDMILSALVDSGLPQEALERELAKLHIEGFSLRFEQATRGGVTGTHLTVKLDEKGAHRRGWRDFLEMVDSSDLSPQVKELSSSIFNRLWEAEAHAHKSPIEEVHLHELGTLDTLVDVVGVVAGLELLEVTTLYSSPLPSSSGVIKSEHGPMPAPSPATMHLLAEANAAISPPPTEIGTGVEMVTPTGAAIVTTLATFKQPAMRLEKVGYGLGTRDTPLYPNVLALWIGEEIAQGHKEDLVLLETNIDDMSPELFGYVQERLFALGANDVWFTPIQMKKSRPGVVLSVLISSSLEAKAVDMVMRETSTLGIRVRPVTRHTAQREVVELETGLGTVRVKIKRLSGKVVGASPEYEDCRRIALELSMPLQEVFRLVAREAEDKLLS